jgi:hypothetical protein
MKDMIGQTIKAGDSIIYNEGGGPRRGEVASLHDDGAHLDVTTKYNETSPPMIHREDSSQVLGFEGDAPDASEVQTFLDNFK